MVTTPKRDSDHSTTKSSWDPPKSPVRRQAQPQQDSSSSSSSHLVVVPKNDNDDDDTTIMPPDTLPMQEPLELAFENVSRRVVAALTQMTKAMTTTTGDGQNNTPVSDSNNDRGPLSYLQSEYDSNPAQWRTNPKDERFICPNNNNSTNASNNNSTNADKTNTADYRSQKWISLVKKQKKKNRIQQPSSEEEDDDSSTRILCILETSSSSNDNINNNSNNNSSRPLLALLTAIRQTWASHCDGVVVIGNHNDTSTTTTPSSSSWWPFVGWYDVYQTHYEQYDWFHYGTTDMFVLIPNLRAYVTSSEIQNAASSGGAAHIYHRQVPLVLGGGQVRGKTNTIRMGYTLNRAALKLLVTRGIPMAVESTSTNRTKSAAHRVKSNKPLDVMQVLQQLRVIPYDTTSVSLLDSTLEQERYHPWSPATFWNHPFVQCDNDTLQQQQAQNSTIDASKCPQLVAQDSIAFHSFQTPDEMYDLYALLQGWCDR